MHSGSNERIRDCGIARLSQITALILARRNEILVCKYIRVLLTSIHGIDVDVDGGKIADEASTTDMFP